MAPSSKLAWANGLMVTGLSPYLAVLGYIAWASTLHGDAAMAAVFNILFGLGLSYIAALVIAWPASWWSRALAARLGVDTRLAIVLRGAVTCAIFPVFAIFPIVAVQVMRS